MPLIVTALRLPSPALDALEGIGTVHGPEEWQDALPDADALIAQVVTPVNQELLARAPRLRIVADAAVGYDNVDVGACHARGIVVTNTPGVLTDATADLAFALMLATVRKLPQAEQSLRAGEFQEWRFWDYLGGDIQDATLGIVGMGRIGQALARRAIPFGMRIQYSGRSALDPTLEASLGATRVDWDTLLSTSDVISIHAPLTPETRHLFDGAALARMKPGSYLINTARGPLIDEGALVEALRSGPLAGAGLDVYEREPIVHPGLLDLPNVVLLPHIGSATTRTRERMATQAALNVREFLSGRPPINPVPV